jgi:hypothetical protein
VVPCQTPQAKGHDGVTSFSRSYEESRRHYCLLFEQGLCNELCALLSRLPPFQRPQAIFTTPIISLENL